jgi:hypothetical protein
MSNNILNDISKVYSNQVAESAVPGKPAERLGVVTAIPKSEQDAARERTLAKSAAIRAKKGITQEGLDPVGKEDVDIDNDGKSNTKKDKYLMNRRNVIKQELATQKEAKEVKRWWDDDGDGKGYEEGEVSGKFKKKKKSVKEGFSNWRQDLSEVMTDKESNKKISEKNVNNKVVINPKLRIGEAVEELGGTLLEMVEIDETDIFEGVLDEFHDSELMFLSNGLIEEVVEEFFYECLEEGYEVDEVEDMLIESIETSAAILNEAKVTLGHDTKIERKNNKLEKVKSAVKKVARGVGRAAGAAVRGAKAIGREVKAGYAAGSGSDSESSSSSGTRKPQPYRNAHQKPGLLSRLGSKLKSGLKKAVASGARAVSRGARDVARKMDGGGSPSTPKSTPAAAKKPAEKPADPWKGSATTPPKAKTKKTSAPKAAAPARKKKSKLDDLLSSVRNEEMNQLDELSVDKMLAYVKKGEKNRADLNKKWDKGTATHREKMRVLGREEGEARASDKVEKKTGKRPYEMNALDKARYAVTKEEVELGEKINVGDDAGATISDFVHSKSKTFKGDSKKQRINRALGAYYAAKKAKVNEASLPGEEAPTPAPTVDKNKNQQLTNIKMMQQKQRQLQQQKFNLQKQGKLPLHSEDFVDESTADDALALVKKGMDPKSILGSPEQKAAQAAQPKPKPQEPRKLPGYSIPGAPKEKSYND